MTLLNNSTPAHRFDSTIPCVAMIFPPLFQFARAWQHPGNRSDWLRTSFWTQMGQQLEHDGCDMLFLPDAMAMARGHDGTTDAGVSAGSKGGIYLDPVTVLSAVAAVTETLKLGGTLSTAFVPPFDIARRTATLHQLSEGRAAWNIVTSAFDAEAQNMGLPNLPPKKERYAAAHQVTAEVLDLWDSFAETALVMDRQTGVFADPTGVGPTASGLGPLTLPGQVNGQRPMLLQAGASPTGRDFAARWADAVFMVAADSEQAQQIRTDLRSRAATAGRDPDEITTLMGVQPIVGSSHDEALAKRRGLEEFIDPPAAWHDLASLFRADPSAWGAEDSAAEFLTAQQGATGAAGFESIVAKAVDNGADTVAKLAVVGAMAQFKPIVTGSVHDVAAQLRQLVDDRATDGFMIMGAIAPSSFTDFAPVIEQLRFR